MTSLSAASKFAYGKLYISSKRCPKFGSVVLKIHEGIKYGSKIMSGVNAMPLQNDPINYRYSKLIPESAEPNFSLSVACLRLPITYPGVLSKIMSPF